MSSRAGGPAGAWLVRAPVTRSDRRRRWRSLLRVLVGLAGLRGLVAIDLLGGDCLAVDVLSGLEALAAFIRLKQRLDDQRARSQHCSDKDERGQRPAIPDLHVAG